MYEWYTSDTPLLGCVLRTPMHTNLMWWPRFRAHKHRTERNSGKIKTSSVSSVHTSVDWDSRYHAHIVMTYRALKKEWFCRHSSPTSQRRRQRCYARTHRSKDKESGAALVQQFSRTHTANIRQLKCYIISGNIAPTLLSNPTKLLLSFSATVIIISNVNRAMWPAWNRIAAAW